MQDSTKEQADDSFVRDNSALLEAVPQTETNTEGNRSVEVPMNMDVETAFNITGGFGRFQLLATIAMCLAMNGGNYLYFAFAYITLEQKYECRFDPSEAFKPCDADTVICPALDSGVEGFEYRVDTSYEFYINNWYV